MQGGSGKLHPTRPHSVDLHIVPLGRDVRTFAINDSNGNGTGFDQPFHLSPVGVMENDESSIRRDRGDLPRSRIEPQFSQLEHSVDGCG